MPIDVAGPGVGDPAPALSLTTSDGSTLSLGGMLGQKILLVFYRGAW